MPRRSPAPGTQAAGGVVWRVENGRVEVAIVHRPRYDDWSLPKGKLHEGEPALAAAVREIGEEVGARVALSRRIGEFSYELPPGRKTVSYWVMRHLGGDFRPSDEVDAVEWLRPKSAAERVSYDVDRRVLDDFVGIPVPDSVVVLVRHAKAGKRSEWPGPDVERPLDRAGEAQAQRLVGLHEAFAPDRIVSAEPTRCVETVRPLAARLGLGVEIDPHFGDAAYQQAAAPTEAALMSLARPGRVTVVCSQGSTIPGLVDRLGRGIRSSDTRKGAFWVLSVVDDTVVSMDYYEDALQ